MVDSPFIVPPAAEEAARIRKLILLRFTLIALLASALIVMVLPIHLPLPVRLAAAGGDVIGALIVFVAWRQASPPR